MQSERILLHFSQTSHNPQEVSSWKYLFQTAAIAETVSADIVYSIVHTTAGMYLFKCLNLKKDVGIEFFNVIFQNV